MLNHRGRLLRIVTEIFPSEFVFSSHGYLPLAFLSQQRRTLSTGEARQNNGRFRVAIVENSPHLLDALGESAAIADAVVVLPFFAVIAGDVRVQFLMPC
jgi:hypothetical protein